MWQNNISWQEGLFSEIPFKRLQGIKTKSQWDAPLAIFTRLNPSGGNDWPNLRLEGIQSPSTPGIGVLDTLISPKYYIVAVDTRIRTIQSSLDLKTQDNINGKVQVKIEYQVSNLETLLRIEDPLSRLKDRTGEKIQEFAANISYFSITENEIKNNLYFPEALDETGITVKRFFNLQIIWPEAIQQRLQKDAINKIDDTTQRLSNKLKIEKLVEFGITNPILRASVLSRTDADFEVIMDHVRSMSQVNKDQMDRDLALFNWLKEKDLLTRADVQKLIESLTTRMNEPPSPLVEGLLTVSDASKKRLTGPSKSAEEEEEKPVEDQQGPKIKKRKVNLDNKSGDAPDREVKEAR